MPLDVALFVPCLTDQYAPRSAVAVVKVLDHFGCRVIVPDAQPCCGRPMYDAGLDDDARLLARQFVRTFEPFDRVVTPGVACLAMLHEHYAGLLADEAEWATRAGALAAKVVEFVPFVTRELKIDLKGFALPAPVRLTYQPVCYGRSTPNGGAHGAARDGSARTGTGRDGDARTGATDAPPRDETHFLLGRLGNVTLAPLGETDQCCGFGGGFAQKFPEISLSIAAEKARQIAATGAAATVCNDTGCAMALSDACRRSAIPAGVRHIAEVLAEALGLDLTTL